MSRDERGSLDSVFTDSGLAGVIWAPERRDLLGSFLQPLYLPPKEGLEGGS